MGVVFEYNGENSFLCAIGWLTVIYIVVKTIYWIYKYYVIHFTPSTIDWNKYGDWALVTGSTDGIGKSIAKELARKGKNIFLVSRNHEKLKQVAKEIENEYKVDTKILAFDFCNFDGKLSSSPYDVIESAIADMEIRIMVNNVGMTGLFSFFCEGFSSPEEHWYFSTNIVHCNGSSRAKMMQLVLPGMLERKAGLILNVSSMSAHFPCPIMSLYCGTKRFDQTLSVALQREYEKHGIIIQSIEPGMVRTNMTIANQGLSNRPVSWRFPAAAYFVSQMMNTIGKSDTVTGFWAHTILFVLYRLLPESTLANVAKTNFKDL